MKKVFYACIILVVLFGLLMSCVKTTGIKQVDKEKDLVGDNTQKDPSDRIKAIFTSLTGINPNSVLRSSDEEKFDDSNLRISNFSPGGFLMYDIDSLERINVLGYSSMGEMHITDTVYNEGLKVLFENALSFSNKEIEDDFGLFNPIDPDHPIPAPFPGIDLQYPKYRDSVSTPTSIKHYTPSTLLYGQSGIFQKHVHKRYLGCANTALATLMSHYRIPKNVQINNTRTTINWDILWNEYEGVPLKRVTNPDLKFQIAEMCACIFYRNPRIWIVPDKKGTAVHPKYVKRFLEEENFHPIYKPYNKEELIEYLKQYKRPILMYGEATFWSRHYWVIDGYAEQVSKHFIYKFDLGYTDWMLDKEYTTSQYFVHCNWGWNGEDNGYFNPALFNPNKKVILKNKNKEEDYTRHAMCYYTYPDLSNLKNSWFVTN